VLSDGSDGFSLSSTSGTRVSQPTSGREGLRAAQTAGASSLCVSFYRVCGEQAASWWECVRASYAARLAALRTLRFSS